MRFAISCNTLSKVLFTLILAGSDNAWVEIDANTVRAQLGWSGQVTGPRSSIISAERVDRVPRWLGYGMHGTGFGTWAINGSNSGVVKLAFSEPVKGRMLVVPIRPTALYLSLEDREGFLAALDMPGARV